jgi:DNA-binding response OmpR family regulator
MKKILIIEDDQIVANIYRNKLAVDGFLVESANNGETGFALVKSFRPDAVILDLILPRLSGVDLMKKIRAEADFQSLPLIVFSNTYLSNLVQDAWKAGATKCLSKANCSPKQVIEAVRSVLGLGGETMLNKPLVIEPRAKLGSSPADIAKAADVAKATEASSQTEMRGSLSGSFHATLTALRNSIKALAKASTDAERLVQTQEMHGRIHTLAGAAGVAGLTELAQLAEALEALIMELHEKPASINASTLRTMASAVDSFPLLYENPRAASALPLNSNILVVDDETISRRAVTHALDRAKLKSVSVEDPNVALQLLSETSYDLVFLDVDMPGMNGHELCTRLRALPRHKKTPVVFVTGLTDFQNRANSTMSGGNDFIAKPFPFLELAVKSLVYVLRGKYPAARPA